MARLRCVPCFFYWNGAVPRTAPAQIRTGLLNPANFARQVKPSPRRVPDHLARQLIGFLSLIHPFTPSLFLLKFADYFCQISTLVLGECKPQGS